MKFTYTITGFEGRKFCLFLIINTDTSHFPLFLSKWCSPRFVIAPCTEGELLGPSCNQESRRSPHAGSPGLSVLPVSRVAWTVEPEFSEFHLLTSQGFSFWVSAAVKLCLLCQLNSTSKKIMVVFNYTCFNQEIHSVHLVCH